jgi:hypothetical protein
MPWLTFAETRAADCQGADGAEQGHFPLGTWGVPQHKPRGTAKAVNGAKIAPSYVAPFVDRMACIYLPPWQIGIFTGLWADTPSARYFN